MRGEMLHSKPCGKKYPDASIGEKARNEPKEKAERKEPVFGAIAEIEAHHPCPCLVGDEGNADDENGPQEIQKPHLRVEHLIAPFLEGDDEGDDHYRHGNG